MDFDYIFDEGPPEKEKAAPVRGTGSGEFSEAGQLQRNTYDQFYSDSTESDIDAELSSQSTRKTTDIPAADRLIEKINLRNAVVWNGGRVLIATFGPGGKIDFGPEADLHRWYANRPYGDKGEPVSKWWMRQAKRRQYRGGVTFAPGGAPKNTLNLWTGFAVEPRSVGSCDLFLSHILNVVCSGNQSDFGYVIRWLAHMVQRPEEKPGVALVLKGNRGAGKDAVGDYLAPILGRHAFKLTSAHALTGRFNRHLAEVLFLHVEEGFWAGDKGAESTLKSLVTSRDLTIEAKGIDAINMPSYLRLFISSNEDWVVPSGHDERRWAVFHVSDVHKQDHEYFAALFCERDNGGTAALLHFLQNVDLNAFDVRAVPQTQGLLDQKLASLAGVEAWWFEVLQEGHLPYTGSLDEEGHSWKCDASIPRKVLRDAYDKWAKDNPKLARPVSTQQFGRTLHELVPDIRSFQPRESSSKRTWHYVVPPLSECRQEFGGRFGVGWSDDDDPTTGESE